MLYGGERLYLGRKWATVITITYFAIMYGALIPLLFPLCFLSLFTILVIDKLKHAYWYSSPQVDMPYLHEWVLWLL